MGDQRPNREGRAAWVAAIAAAATLVVGGGGIIGLFHLSTGGAAADPPSAVAPAGTATSGPSCATGDALPMDTSGSWQTLDGSASAGCGEALVHEATDSGDGANWIFHPGVGRSCTFRIHIPDSAVVTARNVTYQAWDTQPGDHRDANRIGRNAYADQHANRGGVITLTFGPTKNGTIDLQLYDDHSEHATEVADTVVATCR